MIAVLDASAAVEVLLQRRKAEALSGLLAEAEWVLAPTLYVAELTNVFWKYHRYNSLPQETCETALAHGLELPDTLARDAELQREAFAMACRCSAPAYDMFYLVLARRNAATLLTIDTARADLAREHDVEAIDVNLE